MCARSSWVVRISYPSPNRWVADEGRKVWQVTPVAIRPARAVYHPVRMTESSALSSSIARACTCPFAQHGGSRRPSSGSREGMDRDSRLFSPASAQDLEDGSAARRRPRPVQRFAHPIFQAPGILGSPGVPHPAPLCVSSGLRANCGRTGRKRRGPQKLTRCRNFRGPWFNRSRNDIGQGAAAEG